MSTPQASVANFALNTGTNQTILGGVGALIVVQGPGYLTVRNKGANLAFLTVQHSSDGTNFADLPNPYFTSDGIPATTNPQPYPLPPMTERGEFIRILGKSSNTTVDVELYQPTLGPSTLKLLQK